MSKYTLTFADRGEGGGWTSFWGYYPQLTLELGNKFYSIKDGQLWEHYDSDNPERNIIYGKKLEPKIVTILNAENSEDKIFKNIIVESNEPWDVLVKTNMTETSLRKSDFNNKESKWFSYLRKNELSDDLADRVQGIGNVLSIEGNFIKFNMLPTLFSVGEDLYALIDGDKEYIGKVVNINLDENTVEVDGYETDITVGTFCFSLKDARIQGSEIRGYFAELTLKNDSTKPVEMFAVGSNVVISHVRTQYK